MYLPSLGSMVAPLTGSGWLVIGLQLAHGRLQPVQLIGAAAQRPMEHHHLGLLRVPTYIAMAAKLGVLSNAIGDGPGDRRNPSMCKLAFGATTAGSAVALLAKLAGVAVVCASADSESAAAATASTLRRKDKVMNGYSRDSKGKIIQSPRQSSKRVCDETR